MPSLFVTSDFGMMQPRALKLLFVCLFVHHIKGTLATYLKIQKMERKLEDIIFL